MERRFIAISLIAFALVLASAWSIDLTCQTPCYVGSACACSVPSCASGHLIVTDSSGFPIGDFPITSGSASWTPTSTGVFNAQANCNGDLSSVIPISPSAGSSTTTISGSTTTTISGNCNCGQFTDLGCDSTICGAYQRLQRRTCDPAGCQTESQCITDNSCQGSTTTIISGSQVCGNAVCEAGETYRNCCSDCSGCEKSSCSSSSKSCTEKYDVMIDVPATIYKGSQFLLSPKQVVDTSTSTPVDSYTLCWQAYCKGSTVYNMGCNQNVFTIPSDVTCVDSLSGLLSVSGNFYQYNYPVKYVSQLKILTTVFPAQFQASSADVNATFSLSLQNVGADSLDIKVFSYDQSVYVNGTYTITLTIPAGQTSTVSIVTPATPGEYTVQISDVAGTSEVQTQKLIVASGGSASGPSARITFTGEAYFSVAPGGTQDFQVTLQNNGQSSGDFSVYAKGSAASAVSVNPSTVTVDAGSSLPISVTLTPTFSTAGEYSFSLCASPTSGSEYCLPATLNIETPTGGLFDFTMTPERVEAGTAGSSQDVTVYVKAKSTNIDSVSVLFETTCPAGIISGASFLNSSGATLAFSGGSYSNTFKVTPNGKSVSCSVTVTLSDGTGSQTKRTDISFAPSYDQISGIADMASRAQSEISDAESQIRTITLAGKDATSATAAVDDARMNLATCSSQLQQRNYDAATVMCKKALSSADSALSVVKYTQKAYGINPPAKDLNIYVIAGVLVVLVGASVLTFGRMF